MAALDIIKMKMKQLYETQPNVHVNMVLDKKKTYNEPVVITGVYAHIFRIEDKHGESHTMRYGDLLTRSIEIAELNIGIA